MTMKTWVIYMMLFGPPAPTHGGERFDTRSGCELYMHVTYRDLVNTFKLVCVNEAPLMCQGKPCE